MELQHLVMELLAMELQHIQTLEQLQVMEHQLLDMRPQLQAMEANLEQVNMRLLDMADLRCSSHHTGLHPKTRGHLVTHRHLHSHHLDAPLDCNTSPWLTSC